MNLGLNNNYYEKETFWSFFANGLNGAIWIYFSKIKLLKQPYRSDVAILEFSLHMKYILSSSKLQYKNQSTILRLRAYEGIKFQMLLPQAVDNN